MLFFSVSASRASLNIRQYAVKVVSYVALHTEIWNEFAIQWQHCAMRVDSHQSKVMIGYMRTDEKPATGNCLLK